MCKLNNSNKQWIKEIISEIRKYLETKENENTIYKNLWEMSINEMDKFLEKHNLPRLNHEEIENLDRFIFSKEIESII